MIYVFDIIYEYAIIIYPNPKPEKTGREHASASTNILYENLLFVRYKCACNTDIISLASP